MKKILIFGTSAFAEVVYWYFKEDSEYQVMAFTAEREKIEKNELYGLPVVAFEDIQDKYSPDDHSMFVAIGFAKLNAVRADFYNRALEKGYKLATYVHSGVKVWPNNKIGQNTIIFENNTIQPFVEIGDNTVLWSGNHIGHHSKIGNNSFITSHVVVSGFVNIGNSCFIGVNATLRDGISIGRENIIGAGALIMKSTKDNEVYPANRTRPMNQSSSAVNL